MEEEAACLAAGAAAGAAGTSTTPPPLDSIPPLFPSLHGYTLPFLHLSLS